MPRLIFAKVDHGPIHGHHQRLRFREILVHDLPVSSRDGGDLGLLPLFRLLSQPLGDPADRFPIDGNIPGTFHNRGHLIKGAINGLLDDKVR